MSIKKLSDELHNCKLLYHIECDITSTIRGRVLFLFGSLYRIVCTIFSHHSQFAYCILSTSNKRFFVLSRYQNVNKISDFTIHRIKIYKINAMARNSSEIVCHTDEDEMHPRKKKKEENNFELVIEEVWSHFRCFVDSASEVSAGLGNVDVDELSEILELLETKEIEPFCLDDISFVKSKYQMLPILMLHHAFLLIKRSKNICRYSKDNSRPEKKDR
jgi:hypothetical protein